MSAFPKGRCGHTMPTGTSAQESYEELRPSALFAAINFDGERIDRVYVRRFVNTAQSVLLQVGIENTHECLDTIEVNTCNFLVKQYSSDIIKESGDCC